MRRLIEEKKYGVVDKCPVKEVSNGCRAACTKLHLFSYRMAV